MADSSPPGTPGHGSGIVSIRRQAGGAVARDPRTDEWVMAFEVICPDCGDTGGLFAEQTPQVQAVRGPYPGPTPAQYALLRHVGEDD